MDIPYGYCHCGCGFKTKILKNGKPRAFFPNHQPLFAERPPSRFVTIEGVICRTIPLAGGREAIVDVADYDALSLRRWIGIKKQNIMYACGLSRINGKKIIVEMHNVIMNSDKMRVDHKNGNGLDNRRCNLRIATKAQNDWNRGRQKNNKSGFKGVYWRKDRLKWSVEIKANRERLCLGVFTDVIEAARAYDQAALKYHGDFARLNFPCP